MSETKGTLTQQLIINDEDQEYPSEIPKASQKQSSSFRKTDEENSQNQETSEHENFRILRQNYKVAKLLDDQFRDGKQKSQSFSQDQRQRQVSIMMMFLDVLVTFIIWFFFSISICFSKSFTESKGFTVVQSIATIVFLVVILWKFFITNNDTFQGQTKDKIIVNKYLTAEFWFDILPLLSVIGSYFVHAEIAYVIVQLFAFLKAGNICRTLTKLIEQIKIQQSSLFIFRISRIFGQLLIILHVVACLWYLLNYYEIQNEVVETTWLQQSGLYNSEKNQKGEFIILQYWQCLYWSQHTILLGKTDEGTENTNLEMAFQFICVFMFLGIFAFVLYAIGGLCGENYNKSNLEETNRIIFDNYLQSQEIPEKIKQKFKLQHQGNQQVLQHNHKEQQVSDIFATFPENYMEELQEEKRKNNIQKFKILKELKLDDTLTDQLQVYTKYYNPDQTIYDQDVLIDPQLCYIEKGQVEIIQHLKKFCTDPDHQISEGKEFNEYSTCDHEQDEVIKLKTLSKGDTFGEKSFLTGKPDNFCAISKGYLTVHFIRRKDFMEIMMRSEKGYQNCIMIKESIQDNHIMQFNDNSSDRIPMVRKCYICDRIGHDENQCSLVHYSPNKQLILKIEVEKQKRSSYKRLIRVRTNSFRIQNDLSNNQKMNILRNENQEFFDYYEAEESEESYLSGESDKEKSQSPLPQKSSQSSIAQDNQQQSNKSIEIEKRKIKCGDCQGPLQETTDPYLHSQNLLGFRCNECQTNFKAKGSTSWHCSTDDYDICGPCIGINDYDFNDYQSYPEGFEKFMSIENFDQMHEFWSYKPYHNYGGISSYHNRKYKYSAEIIGRKDKYPYDWEKKE